MTLTAVIFFHPTQANIKEMRALIHNENKIQLEGRTLEKYTPLQNVIAVNL